MVKPVTDASAFFTPEQQAKADELTRLKERIQKKIDGQSVPQIPSTMNSLTQIPMSDFYSKMGGNYSQASMAANTNSGYVININTGIGDPNAIAEAIDQVLVDAVQRGTLRGMAY
jgi:hypothetical protein